MNKKISILTLVTMSMFSSLSAQSKQLQQHQNSVSKIKSQTEFEKKNSKIRLGVKAGVNFSNIYEKETGFNYGNKTGIHIGGLVQIPISNKLFLQPELLYSMQGSIATIPEESTELKMKMNYLTIPVIVKYNIFEKFNIEAGPQIGFLLSSNITANYKDEDAIFDDGLTLNDKEYKNKIDFSFGLGASYEINKNIFVGIRYNVGISNVYKKGMEIIDDDGRYNTSRNGVLQISAGYKF
ncbi:porin family protein [Chryseobacterium sp.]|uniref:porin family protein n=1 Tax=Chryseobacterium sp. TaxID=1871047 RepID=UPI0028A0DF33|nr:porin family protein [Chryseobacterium sp.]